MKKILLFGGTGLVGKNFLQCKFADRYEINFPTKQEVNLLDEKYNKQVLFQKIESIYQDG